MNIGINIDTGMDFEQQLKILKENGITRTFMGSKVENFDYFMELADKYGVVCETIHAPFDKINDMWSEDEVAGREMLGRLKEYVDKCAKYNIPVTVVHVSSGRPMPEITEIGVKRYEELFDYASEKGVKVALENLRYFENLKYFFDRRDDVGFCWDDGHQYCRGENIDYMGMFGKRTIALHIHDNRAELDTDDHLLPFDGKIDFDIVAKAIADSGYDGTLMLEVFKEASRGDEKLYENLTYDEFIKRAVVSLNKLNDMVESYK